MTGPSDFSSELDEEFEDLVAVHSDAMYKFAFARIGNRSDAQDIVQETFLKAYRSFDQRNRQGDSRNWLRKILVNNICDFYRQKARNVSTVLLDESESAQDLPASERSEEFEFDWSLQKALSSMSEKFVIPLLLREIDDASYEEISEMLGVPIGTVMSRLARARAQLRKKLASSQPPGQIEHLKSTKTIGIQNEL